MFLRKGMTENAANMYTEVKIVFSCFSAQNMILPCQSLTEGCLISLSELVLTIEEADVRLVPHAIHATQTGAKRLVILSDDTDVMVLALYFNTDLKTNGLFELSSYGCVLVWVILHDISLCIWYLKGTQIYVVYPQQYTFWQSVIQLANLEPNFLLLNHLSPNFSLNLENHCLAQIKMKLYAKLCNILLKYSHPTVPALLWIFLGMKCTTKVKSVISISYHLPVLVYICTFWGICTRPINRCIVFNT